jgi:transcriptional accessory protein Tex/SPT6
VTCAKAWSWKAREQRGRVWCFLSILYQDGLACQPAEPQVCTDAREVVKTGDIVKACVTEVDAQNASGHCEVQGYRQARCQGTTVSRAPDQADRAVARVIQWLKRTARTAANIHHRD